MKKNFSFLSFYLKGYIRFLILGIFFLFSCSIFALLPPLIIKEILQEVLLSKSIKNLINLALVSLAIVFFFALSQYLYEYFFNYALQNAICKIRQVLFERMLFFPMSFFLKKDYMKEISKLINETHTLGQLLILLPANILKEPIILVGSIIFLLYLNWKLALISILIGPLLIFLIVKFSKKIKKKTFLIQENLAKLLSFSQETFSCIKIIQAFLTFQKQKEIFSEKNKEFLNENLKATKLLVGSAPLVSFLSSLGILFIMLWGGIEVIKGNFSLDKLVAFLLYLGAASGPVKKLAQFNLIIQQSFTILERIRSLCAVECDKKGGIKVNFYGNIKFNCVDFSYDSKKILDNLSFEIKKGEKVAIIGPTGSGKTTIINLILGFILPQKGNIFIEGYDVQSIDKYKLREKIGYVPQENLLFSGTVEENIKVGNFNALWDKLDYVMEICLCKDIKDKEVGKGGINLSGGERQRVTIARALLREPEVLILDEATSNLDSKTESMILKNIIEIMRDKTVIFISHRLKNLEFADKVLQYKDKKFIYYERNSTCKENRGYIGSTT